MTLVGSLSRLYITAMWPDGHTCRVGQSNGWVVDVREAGFLAAGEITAGFRDLLSAEPTRRGLEVRAVARRFRSDALVARGCAGHVRAGRRDGPIGPASVLSQQRGE